MESVTSPDIADQLSRSGYFYIMHRFGDTRAFIDKANEENWRCISISVGVQEEDKRIIDYVAIQDRRVDFVTIDIAHGHSDLTKEFIEYVRQVLPTVKIIAGNVATSGGVYDLAKWGADAVKVGIAGGAACSTKNQTGFHVPMWTCVEDCRYPNIPIIADGGIRENGDIAKALVAGANMVMIGSQLAACIDAPSEGIYNHEHLRDWARLNRDDYSSYDQAYEAGMKEIIPLQKRYHGSASSRQKKSNKHVEGIETIIPCNGLKYAEKYIEIKEALQSAISYSGGKDLTALPFVQWYTN